MNTETAWYALTLGGSILLILIGGLLIWRQGKKCALCHGTKAVRIKDTLFDYTFEEPCPRCTRTAKAKRKEQTS